ncbi:hypothetical protein PCO31111_03968 [Pandoraea communis]|uniref:DUF4224 domain-containing protein n=1 Tax=Pandoraea communis TaxID=2508297 RepID=A0A5E4XLQ1_9BURK|nr:DUF4224 domain-containing protein [Pandoraea communis]VVE37160.1 hypothetical protein PCO31111_03968 [Pandoraea communis]
MDTFLTPDEIRYLTGRNLKADQVEALRRMGIPFYVNARGSAIVARCVIEGSRDEAPRRKGWTPNVLGG